MHAHNMTSNLDITAGSSNGDRRRHRAYLREFVPGMVLYAVLLVVALAIGRGSTAGKVLIVLVPLLPFTLVTRAVVRAVGRLDDYQRYVTLRSLAVGSPLRCSRR